MLATPWPAWCLLDGDDPNPMRVAMGGTQPALEGGAGAMRENPALLVQPAPGGTAGIGYSRAFGMEELPLWSAWAGWSGAGWGTGAWMRQLQAGDVYREDLVEAGGALKAGNWSLGASGEAVQVAFSQGLGSAWSGDLSLGLFGRPLPWLSLGTSARQILSSEVGNSGEGLPRDYLAGLAASTPDGRFVTAVSARMDGRFEERPTWQVGQQVNPTPWLTLAGSVRVEPLRLAVGVATR
jgi:hypothetical protein